MTIATFAEFWPVYLAAHADPRCRALHYVGSIAGIAGPVLAVARGDWRWALAGLVVAYACAWSGHFFVERNVPLTFRYPLWSFLSDYRMTWRWLSGALPGDLAAAGVARG